MFQIPSQKGSSSGFQLGVFGWGFSRQGAGKDFGQRLQGLGFVRDSVD